MSLNIQLRGADYEIDGNVITLRSDSRTTVYRLPRRKPRVSVMPSGRGNSQLLIGGFTKTDVTVIGPNAAIEQLKEAVL